MTMQPEPGEQQEKCQSNPRPTPFNVQHNLDKSSFNSSSASDCCSQGAPVCTCGSLTGWSSIQLQEQHLLGACSRSPQDMFVVVLTNAEQQAADSSAQQQKPRASPAAADSSSQASQSTGGRQTFAQYLLKQVGRAVVLEGL